MRASDEPPTDATLSAEDAIAMQKLQLNEAQWARILAENNAMSTIRAPFVSGDRGASSAPTQQVAYLLSLEGDAPSAKWTWYETALDAVVQTLNEATAGCSPARLPHGLPFSALPHWPTEMGMAEYEEQWT